MAKPLAGIDQSNDKGKRKVDGIEVQTPVTKKRLCGVSFENVIRSPLTGVKLGQFAGVGPVKHEPR